MSLLDVTGYLVQLPDNAWLLPASQGQIGVMLDSRAYERAVVALRRYFGVMVIDCETLPAEVARVALSAAHGRVLTAPATPEGITSTYSVLQWMQGLPRHVIAGTVVVLTELVAPLGARPRRGCPETQVHRGKRPGPAVRPAFGGRGRLSIPNCWLTRPGKPPPASPRTSSSFPSPSSVTDQMPSPTVNDGRR